MIAIAFNKFATNAGKTISKWKRNRKYENKGNSHSGFDYARSFNVELVSSNKRRYSSSRRLKK